MDRITSAWLNQMDACSKARRIFKATFPEGAEPTYENLQKVRETPGLDLSFVLQRTPKEDLDLLVQASRKLREIAPHLPEEKYQAVTDFVRVMIVRSYLRTLRGIRPSSPGRCRHADDATRSLRARGVRAQARTA